MTTPDTMRFFTTKRTESRPLISELMVNSASALLNVNRDPSVNNDAHLIARLFLLHYCVNQSLKGLQSRGLDVSQLYFEVLENTARYLAHRMDTSQYPQGNTTESSQSYKRRMVRNTLLLFSGIMGNLDNQDMYSSSDPARVYSVGEFLLSRLSNQGLREQAQQIYSELILTKNPMPRDTLGIVRLFDSRYLMPELSIV